MARSNKQLDHKLRKWFVSYFPSVDPSRINLEKAFKYLNYLKTPEQQTERFLDRLESERRDFEKREADKLERTLVTRYVD